MNHQSRQLVYLQPLVPVRTSKHGNGLSSQISDESDKIKLPLYHLLRPASHQLLSSKLLPIAEACQYAFWLDTPRVVEVPVLQRRLIRL